MADIALDSPSVQSHLSILQSVISRMAANSAGCKTWCIALVSAIIVIIADKQEPDYVWIALTPIALLGLLDAYYLGLEKRFRDKYNDFIRKLHEDQVSIEDMFVVSPGTGCQIVRAAVCSLISLSVWPFYGLLGATLVAVRIWIL
jgi:hypothetical protein